MDIYKAMRAWAKGNPMREEAVEELIKQGNILHEGSSWVTRTNGVVTSVDPDGLIANNIVRASPQMAEWLKSVASRLQ